MTFYKESFYNLDKEIQELVLSIFNKHNITLSEYFTFLDEQYKNNTFYE